MSIILVIGTGRSGTHWLGQLLEMHPGIVTTIEDKTVFRLVKTMALDARRRRLRLPLLAAIYRYRERRAEPRHYADKSHPNIWLAEDLAARLPSVQFVGVERNPYATVASMMRHGGVRRWVDEWQRWPVPNEFLGISESVASLYGRMSFEARCALRWRSHHEQMTVLRQSLRDRLAVFKYEDLIDNYHAEIARLWQFVGLPSIEPVDDVRVSSRDRWRTELNAEQIDEIRRHTDIEPDEWNGPDLADTHLDPPPVTREQIDGRT